MTVTIHQAHLVNCTCHMSLPHKGSEHYFGHVFHMLISLCHRSLHPTQNSQNLLLLVTVKVRVKRKRSKKELSCKHSLIPIPLLTLWRRMVQNVLHIMTELIFTYHSRCWVTCVMDRTAICRYTDIYSTEHIKFVYYISLIQMQASA